MNENKHTPGPWRVRDVMKQHDDGSTTLEAHRVDAGKFVVVHDVSNEANARLIAAAPDMLAIHRDSVEVLEIVLEEREEIVGEDEVLRDLISRIKEVVAKATGAAK